MEVLSLRSSLIFPHRPSRGVNPLSKKLQSQKLHPSHVSCRARRLAIEVEETTSVDFYKMLSLNPKSATKDEIKKAYRSMALQYHPDTCLDPLRKEKCTRMFVQLHAAYETLSDPALREKYDYELDLITSKRNKINESVNGGDDRWRRRWEEQLVELKRRSNTRMAQKEGSSWGSRMRAQNMKNHN